jgi:putative transposase
MTPPILKATHPSLAQVNAQAVQTVAVRIDVAFNAYVHRLKVGKTPEYPRFRGHGRYVSLTYPQAPSGCKLDTEGKRLRLHGVGWGKIILHRPMEGVPKTTTITRSGAGKWRVCFSCAR